jgi:hypothetical protein
MTRVHVLALGLLALACTAARNPPDGKADASSDGKSDGKSDAKQRVCTEMACSDSATITTKLTPAGAPAGKHEFALEVDGVAQTCTVELTDTTQLTHASCTGSSTILWLGPAMRGVDTEMEVGGKPVVMHTEEPIPGEFEWQLSLLGTPAKVHVVHSFAGNVLVDQTAELSSYEEHRPNGEGCEPVCKAASVEWKGP